MSVYRFGAEDAPPVLALHGLTGHGRRWEHLAARHLTEFRVIAPDLRGHGRASALPPWRLEDVADEVAPLVDATRPALVVGHSFGAAVALHLAQRHPELVRGLVLLDPAVGLPSATVLAIAESAVASPDYPDVAAARADKLAQAWADVDPALLDAELAEHLVDIGDGRLRWRMSLPAVIAFWGELARPAALPRAPLPTVLVRATRMAPPVVMPELRDALAARLGDRLRVVELDCDHMIAQARATDVAELVRQVDKEADSAAHDG